MKYFQKDYTIALYNQFEKDDERSYNYVSNSTNYKLKGVKISNSSLLGDIVYNFVNYIAINKSYYYISLEDAVSLIEYFKTSIDNIMDLDSYIKINYYLNKDKCYICQKNKISSKIIILPCNHTCICEQCQNNSEWSKLFVKSCSRRKYRRRRFCSIS